jgi:hypothetical protein
MSVKLWKKIENRKKQKQKHKRIQKVCLRSPSPAQTSTFVSSTAAGLHSLPILRSFGALPGPNHPEKFVGRKLISTRRDHLISTA